MDMLRTDVTGIGNAIVDVIARVEEDFLVKHGMRKGSMTLIDEARAGAIYDAMGPAIEVSGGSAANTTVGAASLGARVAFVGKVKADQLGRVFAHDIRAAGVGFTTAPAACPNSAENVLVSTLNSCTPSSTGSIACAAELSNPTILFLLSTPSIR